VLLLAGVDLNDLSFGLEFSHRFPVGVRQIAFLMIKREYTIRAR
jgi:hypothetical protein